LRQIARERKTRPVSWIKAARKDFEKFPLEVHDVCLRALTVAGEGGNFDIVKTARSVGLGDL